MGSRNHPLRVTRSALGIRAQDLRTLSRGVWWVRRWIASLEAMRLGARLGRARQYAVDGQVTELVVDGARVRATVVGSRPDPYSVTLEFTSAGDETRKRIEDVLLANPMTLGRILAGDLPVEVGEIFHAEGLPLFPMAEPRGRTADGKPVWDVAMRCNCPDWSRPCKHMAAVLLLLGGEVARRPAALLALRGVDVESLVQPDPPGEARCLQRAALAERVPHGVSAAMLVRRLGPVPFWRGTERCVETLERMQTRARAVAETAASGGSIDLRG